ncbi:hypothetical protein Q9U90_003596 [Salmonella enterica]|nr:hypothetical protein [Salmonella enterica]
MMASIFIRLLLNEAAWRLQIVFGYNGINPDPHHRRLSRVTYLEHQLAHTKMVKLVLKTVTRQQSHAVRQYP